MRVGLVGCGKISAEYLETLLASTNVTVVACADLVPERAASVAAKFGISRTMAVDELLVAHDIDTVLNLTVPVAHAAVSSAAATAGKHVYSEKPLALVRDDGAKLLHTAAAHRVRIGVAPDTFLGASVQAARALVDRGDIGRPIGATCRMLIPGHEHWHPAPDFYYQRGGGPLFDMGPYYLTTLVVLLGPVARVSGMARASFPTRTASDGRSIDVETPTHVIGALEFASGALADVVMSFDVPSGAAGLGIDVYGSTGALRIEDPNRFDAPVRVNSGDQWVDAPLTGYTGGRGIGLIDMASAIAAERLHRASGELGLHVLDIMDSLLESAKAGERRRLATSCERPEPLIAL